MTPALTAITEHLDVSRRHEVLAYGNPFLAAELRELHKTPSRITRFSVDAASEVIDLIDDVSVLEKIAAADTRSSVCDFARSRARVLGTKISSRSRKPDLEKQTKNALKLEIAKAVEKLRKMDSVSYPLVIEWLDSLTGDDCVIAVKGLVASRHTQFSTDLLLAFGRALERASTQEYYELLNMITRYAYTARNIVANWPSEFSLRIAELASEIHFRDRYDIFHPDDDFERRYYAPTARWQNTDEEDEAEEVEEPDTETRPVIVKTQRTASKDAVAYWCEVGDWDLLMWCNALSDADIPRAVEAVGAAHESSLMASFILAAPTASMANRLLESALDNGWLSQGSPDRSDDFHGLTALLRDPTGLSERSLVALCSLCTDYETANYLVGEYGVVPEAVLMSVSSSMDVKGMVWHLRNTENSSTANEGFKAFADVFFSRSESLREYFAQAKSYSRSGVLDALVTEKLTTALGSNADAWPVFFSLLNVAQSGSLEEISNAALACA
jgi:hypothetical protein